MTKFKVGDKVRRLTPHINLTKGRVYTVSGVSSCGMGITVAECRYCLNFSASQFEKVEEDTSKYHKHHDLIIAYAKGAKIQVKYRDGWSDCIQPVFFYDYEYRIKPDNEDKIAEIKKTIKQLEEQLKQLE